MRFVRDLFAQPLALTVAYLLPRSVVGWCVVRAGVHATTGEWQSQVVPELTLMDTLERWNTKETR